jgi:hypothetical protein
MASMNAELKVAWKLRPCFVDGREALFHRWIDKEIPTVRVNAILTEKALARIAEKVKAGVIDGHSDVIMQKRVLGLVEYEDGTVAEVEPTSIQFDVERELMEE